METSLKKNYIYNLIYQILTMIIPFITTPYISRVLGSEGIGRYSYAFSIAYYFALFAMLGINNYGNRSIAEVNADIEKRSKVFWELYSLQVLVSFICIICYAIFIPTTSDDSLISWIMIVYIISAALDVNWFFFGMELFRITIMRNIFIKIITVLCIFLFVKKTTDVYVYACIFVLGNLGSQIYLWVKIRYYIKYVKVSYLSIKKHIKPNLILFIPVIAVSLYKYMDKIMLGAMGTKTEVGYYDSCEKLIAVPVAMITALGTVMLPRITNMIASHKRREAERYLEKSLLFAMFLVTPMSFGIMAVAKEFVPLFYGKGFEKCIFLFQVLMPSCLFIAFANIIRTQYLIPNKKDKLYIVSVGIGAAVNLIINALLISNLQSIGVSIGTLCAEAVVCIIQCVGIRNEINISKYFLYSFPILIVGFLMYIIVINFKVPSTSLVIVLIVKVFVGALIYAAFSILFYKCKIANESKEA